MGKFHHKEPRPMADASRKDQLTAELLRLTKRHAKALEDAIYLDGDTVPFRLIRRWARGLPVEATAKCSNDRKGQGSARYPSYDRQELKKLTGGSVALARSWALLPVKVCAVTGIESSVAFLQLHSGHRLDALDF
jgi:hypothetical protein